MRIGQDRTGWDCLESCRYLHGTYTGNVLYSHGHGIDRMTDVTVNQVHLRHSAAAAAPYYALRPSAHQPCPVTSQYDTTTGKYTTLYLYTPGLASLVLCCTVLSTHHGRYRNP